MKRFFKIVWTITKVSYNSNQISTRGKSKMKQKIGKIGVAVFLLLCFLPTMALVYKGAETLLRTVHGTPIERTLFSGLIRSMGVYMLLSAFLTAPAMLFLTKDTELYLALPLHPYEILTARVLAVFSIQYLMLFIFFIPIAAVWIVIAPSVHMVLSLLLTFILLPVVPCVISMILLMLIVGLVPLFRSRNFLMGFSGLIAMIFALSIGFFSGTSAAGTGGTASMFLSQHSPLSFVDYVLPNSFFFSEFVFPTSLVGGILGFVLLIGTTGGIAVLFILLGQGVYLKIATSMRTGGKSKKLSGEAYNKLITTNMSGKTLIGTFFRQENRLLFRTPAYLMNNLLSAFIFPVLFIAITAFKFLNGEVLRHLPDVQAAAVHAYKTDPLMALSYAMAFGVINGFFNGSASMLAGTSISRDARQLIFYRTAPVDFFLPSIAKVLHGCLYGVIPCLLLQIPAGIILCVTPLMWLLATVAMLLTVYFENITTFFLDFVHPKLLWQSEMEAVKQNFNGVISMLGSWVFIGIFVAIYFLLKPDILIFGAVVLVVIALLNIGLTILLKKKASRLLMRLDRNV